MKWYNDVFLKDKAVAGDPKHPPKIYDGAAFTDAFKQPDLFFKKELTLPEFIGFFMIFCNETGGAFKAISEIGPTHGKDKEKDAIYFFEAKKGVKTSYNTLSMNRKAGDLLVARGTIDKDDKDQIKAWNGEVRGRRTPATT